VDVLEEIEKGKEGYDRLFALSIPKLLVSEPQLALNLAFAFEGVSLPELLYSSCCVDEFLFSGKERVTVRTDIDMDVAHRGAGFR
jgi:hypothetical protein